MCMFVDALWRRKTALKRAHSLCVTLTLLCAYLMIDMNLIQWTQGCFFACARPLLCRHLVQASFRGASTPYSMSCGKRPRFDLATCSKGSSMFIVGSLRLTAPHVHVLVPFAELHCHSVSLGDLQRGAGRFIGGGTNYHGGECACACPVVCTAAGAQAPLPSACANVCVSSRCMQDRLSTSGRAATTSRSQWLAAKKRGLPMVLISRSKLRGRV